MQSDGGYVGAHPAGTKAQCPFIHARDNQDAKTMLNLAEKMLRENTFGEGEENVQKVAKVCEAAEQAMRKNTKDDTGKAHHLLGKVYFQMERWGDAARCLELSLESGHTRGLSKEHTPEQVQEILRFRKELLQSAQYNIQNGAGKPRGTEEPMDTAEARGPARNLQGDFAVLDKTQLSPAQTFPQQVADQVLGAFENLTGEVLDKSIRLVANVAGKLAEKSAGKDHVWGYKLWDIQEGDGPLQKLFKNAVLANQRYFLENLRHPGYPEGEHVNGPNTGATITGADLAYRHPQGFFNTIPKGTEPGDEIANSKIGGAQTNFGLNGTQKVEDRVNRMDDDSLPSVRELSRAFLQPAAEEKRVYAPFLNQLAVGWIQFMSHDWFNHRAVPTGEFYSIPLAEDDPARKKHGVEFMKIPKTAPNLVDDSGNHVFPNEVTHWWDGSQIY
ncbi:MAG: peroxidase family protein, partial [Myxococcota bacterium]